MKEQRTIMILYGKGVGQLPQLPDNVIVTYNEKCYNNGCENLILCVDLFQYNLFQNVL